MSGLGVLLLIPEPVPGLVVVPVLYEFSINFDPLPNRNNELIESDIVVNNELSNVLGNSISF